MFIYQALLKSKDSILEALSTSVQQDLRTPLSETQEEFSWCIGTKYVDTLPKGETGGLQSFYLTKGAGNRDVTTTMMTEELDDLYMAPSTYVNGCCLDKFMVDYDMFFAEET